MTYNFDPDRWLACQLEAVAERRRRGELDDGACKREREAIELRYERMVDRLDGTYRLPAGGAPADRPDAVDDKACGR
ncbi:MAG TPA: hypothetical protein PKJ99_15330 [Thermoanaerobaculales bacterium]|nr:hypothetical protein [Thermoanaerobaculales bacterium]HPA79329.1 hypothetical protein [Thermoanaerobaculales bacterium]HQL30198.1 hypothetical protein [Thermoanaerobaculales bacterium]HQN96168.1 hypothetical protein [Thermoanaerobaculales bacterium]HQP45066.1 hypothetical protein [Thermoanaerobaculales bacterium]